MGKAVGALVIVAAVAVNFVPGAQGWASALIINAGLSAGLSVGAGLAIASYAVTGITLAALAAAASFVAPSMGSIKGASGGAVNSMQPISNATIVYGRAHVGGPLIFYHATQGEDEYRYFVVALAGHEVEAIESIMLNDEVVTLSSNKVTTGDYAENCWIWAQTGADTDAPPPSFTSETGGRWTSAHKGLGVAKLYLKFKLTDEVISGGLPKMTAVVRGKRVFDPRTNATAYSNNAALCFWDYMRTSRSDGGYGLEEIEIDWAHVAAEASICDEDVALATGGTEPRYCCDGVIDTGAGPDTIRAALLVAMAGDYAEIGPRVYAYAGAWRPVVGQLHENDIISDIGYRPLGTNSTYVNEVRGVFISEPDKWQPIEFPSVSIDDGEEPQTLDLELALVKSASQAQRIAKIMLHRARAEKSLTWPMNIRGLEYTPLDNVTISQTLYPHLANYSFQIRSWELSDQFGVTMQLVEESPDFYEWTIDDEQAISRPSLNLVKVNPGQIGAGGAATGLSAVTDGTAKIVVSFTMPASAGAVSYSIMRNTSTNLSTATMVANGVASASQLVSYDDTSVTSAVTYSYWVIVYTYFGSFTAPAGPVTRTAL